RWTEPRTRPILVSEVDVVGARRRFALRSAPEPAPAHAGRGPAPDAGPRTEITGWPLPRREAPRGARLIARFRIANWIVARFALQRPERLSLERLSAAAPRFFRGTPASLLIFVQVPAS
ncbi:MAG: hypothetical protein ACRDTP_12535, partial [Mycobacteriales bacterium]